MTAGPRTSPAGRPTPRAMVERDMSARLRRGLVLIGVLGFFALPAFSVAAIDDVSPAEAPADALADAQAAPGQPVLATRVARSTARESVLPVLGLLALVGLASLGRAPGPGPHPHRQLSDVSDAWRSLLLRAPPTVA